ncbi:MAG: hypothetical protein H6Q00_914 [Holophagaceae bacterium]|nr:hypothetical protein [Holophagaceae bacterium]
MLKPWREIAVPHSDVLVGKTQQAEFAADLMAVHNGQAMPMYQNASQFYQRTFITEGMRLLLTSVAQRLNGQGGDPVIQLQTAFGGGKTHTLLAVYHLAKRDCAIKDMPGVAELLDRAKLVDVPASRIAVLDGIAMAPGQIWDRGGVQVRTLWGEMAWQLGGVEGYAMVEQADVNGTSPGKEILEKLLSRFSPCVLLLDELVAYIRQFAEKSLPYGGTYDTNLSFMQALTESIKLVPNAILLVSLPESEVEAGSQKGLAVLKAMEKTFGRIQALWKPVATEEAFEIVRRRLFEPIQALGERDAVCRAFADLYKQEGTKVPSSTHEARYYDRLVQAYPIHPEVFDRLYEDWSSIEGFQRTRGVLKLMARVIHSLWQGQNADLMIMPGSIPLHDSLVRGDFIYHLQPGWDPVMERDIDGERAETTSLENKETRFGAIQAARRTARTIFLATAPSSTTTKKPVTQGVDRAHVLLGCLQPGQTSSVYSDALNRLVDVTHYLHTTGDKTQEHTLFRFDTRAGLRREMEDRKRRFDDAQDLRPKLFAATRKQVETQTYFDAVHTFTAHGDVPDDSGLRLVVLPLERFYSRQMTQVAFDEILDYVRSNGQRPRHRGNRLVFLVAEHDLTARLKDALRTALAWKSIVEDAKNHKLNIDLLQMKQAEKELQTAEDVLPRVIRECFKWLLCPVQHTPTGKIEVEAFPVNTSGSSLGGEIERVCRENELVIETWSPIHLAKHLKNLYWKEDRPTVGALTFWEDSQKYLYLPRLKSKQVLEQAIVKGCASQDFFGTAMGETDGKFLGFQFGSSNVQLDDTLLLIEPEAARSYEAALKKAKQEAAAKVQAPAEGVAPAESTGTTPAPAKLEDIWNKPTTEAPLEPTPAAQKKASAFFGEVDVKAGTAKATLMVLAEEIISLLNQDPKGTVKVRLNIEAEFPEGAPDFIKRGVSENGAQLGVKGTWE